MGKERIVYAATFTAEWPIPWSWCRPNKALVKAAMVATETMAVHGSLQAPESSMAMELANTPGLRRVSSAIGRAGRLQPCCLKHDTGCANKGNKYCERKKGRK